MATVFVHFHNNNLNLCTNTRLLSCRYSVSLRAKHSVGSRGKAPVRGLVGGRSPPEADHADEIMQFNAKICRDVVLEASASARGGLEAVV